MWISSLQLRKLVTKIVSTQSSQILRIFFFAFTFIGQRVDTTVKIILTKKHIKSAGMFNQQKCWLKVLKCLWTSLIFIHASAKIYVSIWAPTVHCEIDFFLHTYASSKKKLYTVRKLSPKLSWICIFSQTFIVVNVFSRLHKIYLKRIKKKLY